MLPIPQRWPERPCAGCLGSLACWVCLGTGRLETWAHGDEPCSRCHGSGRCSLCSGSPVAATIDLTEAEEPAVPRQPSSPAE